MIDWPCHFGSVAKQYIVAWASQDKLLSSWDPGSKEKLS